jgi:hypothetical protein
MDIGLWNPILSKLVLHCCHSGCNVGLCASLRMRRACAAAPRPAMSEPIAPRGAMTTTRRAFARAKPAAARAAAQPTSHGLPGRIGPDANDPERRQAR